MRFINLKKKRGEQFSKRETVIFLPGWGFDGHILELMKPPRNWFFPDTFLDPDTVSNELSAYVTKNDIDNVIIVGWSMGGYLALDFARKYPDKITALYLFSLRQNWPHDEVQGLRADLKDDPAIALKGFYRRCFLGQKKIYKAFMDRLQERYLKQLDKDVLMRGLDYLESVSVENIPDVFVKTYHGSKDIISPIHEAAAISGTQTKIIENGSHAFFLAEQFDLPFEKRKKILQQKFSKAANSYDEYAFVQKKTVELLVTKLPSPEKVSSVLEVGCGTGNYTVQLAQKLKEASITAIDFSDAMLSKAQEKLNKYPNITFHCGDAEQYLSSTKKTYDLITSNATMQWFDNFSESIDDIWNLLQDNGMFIASVFGSQSFKKLRLALESLFGFKRGVPSTFFPDKERLENTLGKFRNVHVEEHIFEREYASMHDLLTHIKKTGTGGWHAENPPVFTRKKLELLDEWFDTNYGGYTITYQVFVVTASK